MRFVTALTVLVVAALAAATPAGAQAPIHIGNYGASSLVVDPGGTAHIAFKDSGGYTYCRLPRNARTCDVRTLLPLAERYDAPQLRRRADGALLLIGVTDESDDTGLYGFTYVFISLDNGVTWSVPKAIAGGEYGLSAVALAADGNAVFTLRDNTDRLDLQYAPFGGFEARSLNVQYGNGFAHWNDLEVLPDGRAMVLFGDHQSLRWRLFAGGDPYDINTWAGHGSLRHVFDAALVSGPRGPYLFEHRTLADQRLGNAAPFRLRKLDTRRMRFRRPAEAAADRSVFGSSYATQDARGRLHVIAETGGAGRTTCVLYTRTGTPNSRRHS